MVSGWPLEAIRNHLEALTFGDIPSNRLRALLLMVREFANVALCN
jgi:hypothetical protein